MNQQGFSLIEIMVVIAIISILSAIAIPGYQSYMQKQQLLMYSRLLSHIKTVLKYVALIEGVYHNVMEAMMISLPI
ncbi:prepilin-type N-terminal cleavage/methylation domain-containing protein [Providencia hangzhouensis]|uniref:Prepilin-type N-terminal cleavage/methylation domain-containing protein n=1 Tax=Providencia rettgeri TaxID=587 RepID=A0A939NJX1_PRORE|nr:prepilin-type N-terminal cleavage/methylation domain-containing protein [Providencia rettgeri]CAC9178285.1 Pilin [Providencia rettgeri]